MGAADGVLITGVYGTGKSSLAAEIAERLERQRSSFAAVDMDWLGWFATPGGEDSEATTVFLANLAAVVDNYLRAGIERFVFAGAVRDRVELDRIASAVRMPLRVVRLMVPLAEIGRRLSGDPTTGRRDDLRVAAEWLSAGTGVGIEDLSVVNDGPICEVAESITEWLGWTAPEVE